ncbi:MAG: undecaprenyl-diphosphate phosphatase [Synergistaceae bacterium]|jgi:undecaprenyl-diphosphatase|nr:undecaprenyl-diphosphate phosphatase [Synergistaceae bacterium]
MTEALGNLILGAVQGVTEFLPVSSSGHLAVARFLFGVADPSLSFDILLHCATLPAVLIFFRHDIMSLVLQLGTRGSEGRLYAWAVIAATVVTALVAMPLRHFVEAASSSPLAVGVGFVVTSILLCVAPLFSREHVVNPLSLKIALLIGLAQGLAVFPGVSRSGTTISVALLIGLSAAEAFRFSFLLSVPAILGAMLLEAVKMHQTFVMPDGGLAAMAAAFVLGLLSLSILRRLVLSGRWAYFSIYCFCVGVALAAAYIARAL